MRIGQLAPRCRFLASRSLVPASRARPQAAARERPLLVREIATLVANAFIGSEALLLLGLERPVMPIRSALRRIGVVIREREEAAGAGDGTVVAG